MTVGQRVQTLELTTSDLRSELSQARRRVSRLASAVSKEELYTLPPPPPPFHMDFFVTFF